MQLSGNRWLIKQNEFKISGHLETCFTLANGYLGVRGTFEEGFSEENPGTYIAGIYDKSSAEVTELVNLPYFFTLKFYIDDECIDSRLCNILDFRRILDMKQGLLYKFIRLKDKRGRITKIEGYRFLSIDNRHFAGMDYQFTAENYQGTVVIESIIDGTISNSKDDPLNQYKHFRVIDNKSSFEDGIYFEIATFDHDYRVGIASSLMVEKNGRNTTAKCHKDFSGECALEKIEIGVEEATVVNVNKYIAVASSREYPKCQIRNQVQKLLREFETCGIIKILQKSTSKYRQLWEVMNIEINGDMDAEKAIRFNMFHLINCANPEDKNISIGSRGLHGEGYKGHIFWDTEIFMVPFFIYSEPKAASSLLIYRYNTLNAARENAEKNGYRGAQYPWESAENGGEEAPKWGVDYRGNPVRIWTGDIEHHISADIAYAFWEYYRATDDEEFLLDYGIEVILETARFWSSRVEYNEELNRYEINNVIGPDEFHEHVNNNIYTNYLARWNIDKGLKLLDWLEKKDRDCYTEMVANLSLTERELKTWKKIVKKIYIPYDPEKGLMEQFEGYFKLDDIKIKEYDKNNMPVWPQGIDNTALNNYTLIKQADVIMLLHLFGEDFDFHTKKRNFKYYEQRTMHKSSLSPGMYSLMGLVVGDHSKAYDYLMRTAQVDLVDNQRNTAEGFHAASAGGTWQAAVFGFGGMFIDKNSIIGFDPRWIPSKWDSYSFRIHWKGAVLKIKINHTEISVEMVKGDEKLNIILGKEKMVLNKGELVKKEVIIS